MSGHVHQQPRVAAVILAAGDSSRMPGIKQLLPWKNSTLTGYVLHQMKSSLATDIYLVLGAHQSEIVHSIEASGVTLIENRLWDQGMGKSIAVSIDYLLENNKEYDGVLFVLVDQPLITINHYNKLINSCIDPLRIVSSYYSGGPAVPAVFGNRYFKELKSLDKDSGAKSIIFNHLEHLVKLDIPEGAIDLDTKDIYNRFYRSHGGTPK